ncbi:hypothetical protein ACOSQ3_003685 [Xanthoceras sorbifolium]
MLKNVVATVRIFFLSKKQKKFRKKDSHFLSNLQQGIIDHIFSFLEARDTIRASAVSRNWRYLWVSMLCFNFDFMEPYWENQINLPPTTSGDIYARYKDFVNWLLISRNRSIDNERASLFWLHVPGDYSVHRWIKVLSRSKVQKFDLTMCTHVPSIELPHCLVTCHSLVALKLDVDRNCVMNLPTRAGFTSLNSLELLSFLANLEMRNCMFQDFNTLGISATRLEKLAIFSWEPHIDDGLENLTVKVACPSLVTLEFIALSVADFKFQDLNCLQYADVFLKIPPDHASVAGCHNILNNMIKGLVEDLKVILPFLEFNLADIEPDNFSTSFNNLKTL